MCVYVSYSKHTSHTLLATSFYEPLTYCLKSDAMYSYGMCTEH